MPQVLKKESETQMTDETIAVAKNVLLQEARALEDMANYIGQDFEKAIDLLLNTEGRVIVSGMGKSGHVGKKIAATLASTGCISFFVHPAEASHGDLGMVDQGDVLILISNSGETAELQSLINYAKRYELPIIGITKNRESTLATASTVLLQLMFEREACALALAPTTSSTLTMALGDALAVALMQAKGFTPEDFKAFHPGGKLGKQLQFVRDAMHDVKSLPIVYSNDDMKNAIIIMSQKGFGSVCVVDQDNKMVGVITDGDLRRHMSDGFLNKKVCDVMTSHPKVARPNMVILEALAIMEKRKITALFVVDDAYQPMGLIHIHDILGRGVA